MRSLFVFGLLSVLACSDPTSGLEDAAPADRGPTSLDAKSEDAEPVDAVSIDAEPIDATTDSGASLDAESEDAEAIEAGADAGRSCDDIEADYNTLVTMTRCKESTDCAVRTGHCYVGLGGCWYTISASVSQASLDLLGNEYGNLGCTTAVCDCAQPPASALCDQGFCMPGP